MPTDVLIVGAGPTGLVLALWLTRQGVKVRIIDRAAAPGQASRALAVQARTLELYRQLDLAEAVLEKGHETAAVNLWVEGAPKARLAFGELGQGLTPYPFLHIFPQDEHERLLIQRLESLGVVVERGLELTGLSQRDDGVVAQISRQGRRETCEASFVCGCDGARSVVREAVGASFPGGTYKQLFYVADVEAAGPPANGELHIDLDEADFLGVFPLAPERRVRLIGVVREDRVENPDGLKFEDVGRRAIRNLGIEVGKVNWFSTYHVHHRVADRFQSGRALILGDAAHIHSPAGGQGMNTGIGDAINLAWKLAAVTRGEAPASLLQSFEAERIGFARRLVATTDRLFTFASAEGQVADLLRTRIAPLVLPRLAAIEPAREYVFRTVSQITLEYRGSPLSEGAAGKVRGGDRLPWAPVDGTDNFAPLAEIGWQVHVYGAPTNGLRDWCARRGAPLHAFPWRAEYSAAGFHQDAAYLLRPDTYVALASPTASVTDLDRYLADRGLRVGAP